MYTVTTNTAYTDSQVYNVHHVDNTGPHLCEQIIGQSAHVVPGASLIQVYLGFNRNS